MGLFSWRKDSGKTEAAARLAQACGHGFCYGAAGVVILESPDEGATQAAGHTRADVSHLQPDGDGVVVGPKGVGVGVVEPNRNSLIIEMTSETGEAAQSQVSDHTRSLQVIRWGKRSRAGGSLIEAVIRRGNAGPAASIGRNTEH